MNEERSCQNEQTLDQAISLIQQMPVPEAPGVKALLAKIPSQASDRPIPHSNRTRRSLLLRPAFHFATAAALVLLVIGWLVLSSPASIALATSHRGNSPAQGCLLFAPYIRRIEGSQRSHI